MSRANTSSEQPTNQPQSQTKTFAGEISRYPSNCDPALYVIYPKKPQKNYFLDDGSKVAHDDEKVDEIKGTLDQTEKTDEVESVEPRN